MKCRAYDNPLHMNDSTERGKVLIYKFMHKSDIKTRFSAVNRLHKLGGEFWWHAYHRYWLTHTENGKNCLKITLAKKQNVAQGKVTAI